MRIDSKFTGKMVVVEIVLLGFIVSMHIWRDIFSERCCAYEPRLHAPTGTYTSIILVALLPSPRVLLCLMGPEQPNSKLLNKVKPGRNVCKGMHLRTQVLYSSSTEE